MNTNPKLVVVEEIGGNVPTLNITYGDIRMALLPMISVCLMCSLSPNALDTPSTEAAAWRGNLPSPTATAPRLS